MSNVTKISEIKYLTYLTHTFIFDNSHTLVMCNLALNHSDLLDDRAQVL